MLKAYLLAAFAFRFLVEFVRGNEMQALGLTGPQLVLIPMTALLVAHFVREARDGRWRVPAPPAPTRARPPAEQPAAVQEGAPDGLATSTT